MLARFESSVAQKRTIMGRYASGQLLLTVNQVVVMTLVGAIPIFPKQPSLLEGVSRTLVSSRTESSSA